jgi:hypothetical protein
VDKIGVQRDPNTEMSFPLIQINEPVTLINSSQWKYKKYEKCGIPSYCP